MVPFQPVTIIMNFNEQVLLRHLSLNQVRNKRLMISIILKKRSFLIYFLFFLLVFQVVRGQEEYESVMLREFRMQAKSDDQRTS